MSFLAILEVAIGLTFMYLLLSLTASWINEWIAHRLRMRARGLENAIKVLLQDPPEFIQNPQAYLKDQPEYQPIVEQFYRHSLVRALCEHQYNPQSNKMEVKRRPSYIPSRTFALVALDILFPNNDLAGQQSLAETINQLPDSEIKQMLLTFARDAGASSASVRSNLEQAFDDTMERLSGWYKRKVHLFSLIIGLGLAVVLNFDSIALANTFWRDPVLRASVVGYVQANASEFTPPDPNGGSDIPIDKIDAALTAFNLPIGWTAHAPRSSAMLAQARVTGQNPTTAVILGWLAKITGWALTGLAVSQGAPFWFDVLNKIVNLRASGKIPASSHRNGSASHNTKG